MDSLGVIISFGKCSKNEAKMGSMSLLFARGMTKRVKFQHGSLSHSYFWFMLLRSLASSRNLLKWLSSWSTVARASRPWPTIRIRAALSLDFLVSGCSVLFNCHICEDWVGFSIPNVLCQSSLMWDSLSNIQPILLVLIGERSPPPEHCLDLWNWFS